MRRVYILLLIAWLLVVWDVTFVWWMGDGLEDLSGERRAVAEEFLSDAPVMCLDHPIQRVLTRHLHVSIGEGARECREPPAEFRGFITGRSGGPPEDLHSWFGPPPTPPRDVYVDVYTVLGLPMTRITQKACSTTVQCW